MLRKINIALGCLALLGAIALGVSFAYDHFSDLERSKIITQLEG